MQYKSHLLFGTITGIALAVTAFDPTSPAFSHPVLLVGGSMLGSLFPDIDTEHSMISSHMQTLSQITSKIVKVHRGPTHDALLWGILSLLCIPFPALSGFFLGVFGHLLLDSMTKNGICWGYALHSLDRKRRLHGLKHGELHLLPGFFRFHGDSFTARAVTVLLSIFVLYATVRFRGESVTSNISLFFDQFRV
jgi:inner membrane protein